VRRLAARVQDFELPRGKRAPTRGSRLSCCRASSSSSSSLRANLQPRHSSDPDPHLQPGGASSNSTSLQSSGSASVTRTGALAMDAYNPAYWAATEQTKCFDEVGDGQGRQGM
jgi:hypothetical protein